MGVRKGWILSCIAAGLALLPADSAIAQVETTATVALVDANGAPIAGVGVFTQINRIKSRRGTTDSAGETQVTAPIADGTQVQVYARYCDGELEEIHVVPADERHEWDDDDDCDCEPILGLIWGQGRRLLVRTGTRGPVAISERGRGFSWYFGAAYDAKILREVTFRGVASDLTVDQTVASGGSAYFGIALGPFVRAGVRGGIANVDRDASINGDGGTFDYHEYELGPRVRLLLPRDRFDLFFVGTAYYMWNKGDFPPGGLAIVSRAPLAGLQTAAAQQETVHRVHKSWRYDLGGGATYWFAPRFGFDTEVVYSPKVKGEDDADEHVRISIGLVYNGGAICGGQCGGRR